MTARIVPRAQLHDILMFLKGRGVSLSDEAVDILRKRIEEEPVGKPTLERSRDLTDNPFFRDILDRAFVSRSEKLQHIADTHPVLRAIDKRKQETAGEINEPPPMPVPLRDAFYDESKWQPFMPFLGIPPGGRIVKVVERAYPDRPYIGWLTIQDGATFLYTTRRRVNLDDQPEAKFFRMREGVFAYEKEEVAAFEKGYHAYIMSLHK